MDKVYAELTLAPTGYGPEGTLRVPLARTTDPRALRFLKSLILSELERSFEEWAEIDPGISVVEGAEVEKIRQILSLLIPEESSRPDLRPIDGAQAEIETKEKDPDTLGREPGHNQGGCSGIISDRASHISDLSKGEFAFVDTVRGRS